MLLVLRNLLRADAPADIFRLSADAAMAGTGASAAALVRMLPSGATELVEGRNLPETIGEWNSDLDAIDAELGERLRRACGGRFAAVRTLPLVSGGDIFGAIVLFFDEPRVDDGRSALAESLADVTAISLGKAYSYADLARSNAELRASRRALERGEKLRALGQMAAGVSHDLRNILNPLSLNLQFLRRSLKHGGEGAVESIGEMEQVLRRGLQTIERLRDFSRQTPETKPERVEIDALAREAADISKPRLSSAAVRAGGLRIALELGSPRPVLARSGEFVAALVNLLANAIDASPEGGTVTVATGERDGGAWVRVRDQGPGIPEELQHRVFEPFFTTKGDEGTGLGLPMVYAFVERHGGKLSLESDAETGTCFTIWLPGGLASP